MNGIVCGNQDRKSPEKRQNNCKLNEVGMVGPFKEEVADMWDEGNQGYANSEADDGHLALPEPGREMGQSLS